MTVAYVGPSVLISSRGVTFDAKKEDKFLYLFSAAELLDAIDHTYIGGEVYSYASAEGKWTVAVLLEKLKRHNDDIETVINTAEASADAYIDGMVKRVRASTTVTEAERSVYIDNIELMRTYMIQRHINKRVYYAVVAQVVACLRQNRIAYISATMNAGCFHVLNTIQRCLHQQKRPVNSLLSFEREGDALMVKLSIADF
ncbi:hypothetical protein [Sulfurimonas sp. HSL3-7]|uniref:hypothetical protein n=1 Tax=Sulfonitrofixus jiaomeiensis TaxID=3131938 RepID=UPI0031F8865E